LRDESGFTLIELLTAIVIIAVVAAVVVGCVAGISYCKSTVDKRGFSECVQSCSLLSDSQAEKDCLQRCE